jgi:hypothetical protein
MVMTNATRAIGKLTASNDNVICIEWSGTQNTL